MGRKYVDGKLKQTTIVDNAQAQKDADAYQALLAAEGYKQNRREDYPEIGDQLDAIWKEFSKRRDGGEILPPETDVMLTDILATKTKHPKPA